MNFDPSCITEPCLHADGRCAGIEKEFVALHEAAHAAVAFALGREHVKIELKIEVEIAENLPRYTFSGLVSTGQPRPATRASVTDYGTICAAGSIAEARRCRYLSLADHSAHTADGDLGEIDRAADWSEVDRTLFRQKALSHAAAALDVSAIWLGVCNLSRALRWPNVEGPGEHTSVMRDDEIEAVLHCAGVQRGMLNSN